MDVLNEHSKTDSAEVNDRESVRGADASSQLEARELKPRFNIWAAIGIQFSISATPLAVGVYITLVLGAGGSPYFFYAFLVAAFGQMLVCTCMAEIASVFPHASGKCFGQLDYHKAQRYQCADVFQKARSSGLLQWHLPNMPGSSAIGTDHAQHSVGSSQTQEHLSSQRRFGRPSWPFAALATSPRSTRSSS